MSVGGRVHIFTFWGNIAVFYRILTIVFYLYHTCVPVATNKENLMKHVDNYPLKLDITFLNY